METFSDVQSLKVTSSAPFVKKLLKYVYQHKKVKKTACAADKGGWCRATPGWQQHTRCRAESALFALGFRAWEQDFMEIMVLMRSAFWKIVSMWLENLGHLGGFSSSHIENKQIKACF